MIAYIYAAWGDRLALKIYIEAVHRLDASSERSSPMDAWDLTGGLRRRGADRATFWRSNGDMDSRGLFAEADLDAAHRPIRGGTAPGAATGERGSRAYRTRHGYFAARDWDALADIVADDYSSRRSPTGRECGINMAEML